MTIYQPAEEYRAKPEADEKAAKVVIVAPPGGTPLLSRLSAKEKGHGHSNAIGKHCAHHHMMAMSNGYKICIMDSQHHISLAFDLIGPNDGSAVQKAREYAAQNGVEVWKGSRLVAQIARRAS